MLQGFDSAWTTTRFDQFFLHDVYGLAKTYARLADALAANGAFWAARHNPCVAGSFTATTLDEMLDLYTVQILETARRPVVLGGYCYGTDLAHCLAVRLQAAGLPVAGVVLIEGYKGLGDSVLTDSLWTAIRTSKHKPQAIFDAAVLNCLFAGRETRPQKIGDITDADMTFLHSQSSVQHYSPNFLKMCRTVEELNQTLRAVQTHASFGRHFTFDRFKGRGLLIRGPESDLMGLAADNGYGAIVDDLTVENTAIEHHAFLGKHAVKETANLIQKFYDRL